MNGPAKVSDWLEALAWAEAALFPSRPLWLRPAGGAAWIRVSTGAELERRLSELFFAGGRAELARGSEPPPSDAPGYERTGEPEGLRAGP